MNETLSFDHDLPWIMQQTSDKVKWYIQNECVFNCHFVYQYSLADDLSPIAKEEWERKPKSEQLEVPEPYDPPPRNYKCEDCDKDYATKHSLMEHYRMKHKVGRWEYYKRFEGKVYSHKKRVK